MTKDYAIGIIKTISVDILHYFRESFKKIIKFRVF